MTDEKEKEKAIETSMNGIGLCTELLHGEWDAVKVCVESVWGAAMKEAHEDLCKTDKCDIRSCYYGNRLGLVKK